jgi:mannose-6-phosphate isomerase-like protein (cupin superfamily)
MLVGSEWAEVGEGTLVFVPPGTEHAIRNDGTELLSYVSATAPPFDEPELGSLFTFERR